MKCFKCNKEAVVKYPNGDLCNDCFIEMLTARVKKGIRAENAFKKDDKVLVFGKLARFFLEKAIENLPIEIKESEVLYSKDVLNSEYSQDKVVIPWTADDEAAAFYEELTKSNPDYSKIGKTSKFVKIFKSVLNKELSQAAKILNIEFKSGAVNNDIEKIQSKYPSSKFGLSNAAEEFKRIIR